MSELGPDRPHVGIFWFVGNGPDPLLVVDRLLLAEAEAYGNCLTHPGGHHEVWERWKLAGAMWLKGSGLPVEIASSEYDVHPRGRVVFDALPTRFFLYADRRLQTQSCVASVICAFGLAHSEVLVRSDDHYR